MRITYFLLCFVPSLVLAQYDFDSRYFTIDATSLPKISPVNDFTKTASFASKFSLDNAPEIVSKDAPSFKLTKENYRKPVDMATAVSQQTKFLNSDTKVSPIEAKVYGFTGYSGYSSDKSSGVQNTVYKEQKGLNFLDPCPPIGICPRCAPYKITRRY